MLWRVVEKYLSKLFGPHKDGMAVDQKAVFLVSKVNESRRHGERRARRPVRGRSVTLTRMLAFCVQCRPSPPGRTKGNGGRRRNASATRTATARKMPPRGSRRAEHRVSPPCVHTHITWREKRIAPNVGRYAIFIHIMSN